MERKYNMERNEFIAELRYLGWICFQMGANLPLHDVDMKNIGVMSDERKRSLIGGTEFILSHPDVTPEDNHESWMRAKAEQGYVYGPILDVEKKTHPSMIPYEELSDVEKRKDEMDILMTKLALQFWYRLKDESNLTSIMDMFHQKGDLF